MPVPDVVSLFASSNPSPRRTHSSFVSDLQRVSFGEETQVSGGIDEYCRSLTYEVKHFDASQTLQMAVGCYCHLWLCKRGRKKKAKQNIS